MAEDRKFKAVVTWIDYEIDPESSKENASAAFKQEINNELEDIFNIESLENIEEL